jgi:hypothetical protein
MKAEHRAEQQPFRSGVMENEKLIIDESLRLAGLLPPNPALSRAFKVPLRRLVP